MSKTLEKLDTVGADLIDEAQETGEKILAFMEREVPELVSEVIAYERIACTSWLCFSTLLTIVGGFFFYRMIRRAITVIDWNASASDPMFTQGGWCIFGCIISSVSMVVGFIATTSIIQPFLKVWVAPRVYLLEYFSKFVT